MSKLLGILTHSAFLTASSLFVGLFLLHYFFVFTRQVRKFIADFRRFVVALNTDMKSMNTRVERMEKKLSALEKRIK